MFKDIVPSVLQSKSLEKPGIQLIGYDYSAMSEFIYTEENAPTYLKDSYGIDVNAVGCLNVGKLVWENFQFVDSKNDWGVQIVDLLASGLRRCLRGKFDENTIIAKHLGRMMVQNPTNNSSFPIRFITLSNKSPSPDDTAAAVSRILRREQRSIII